MFDTAARRRRIVDRLEELAADALLVTHEPNVRYLTGFTGDSTYLLLSSRSVVLLSDGRYQTQLSQECPELERCIRPPTQRMEDLVQSAIQDSAFQRVAIESPHLALSEFRHLERNCPGVQWVETAGTVEAARMVKDTQEIELTRQAIRVAEDSLASVLESWQPGDTERAVAYRIEAEMRSRGAAGCSFAPIVAAGPAAALPHYQPADTEIGDSAVLLIDWGAHFEGYTSDLTRTFHRGSKDDDFRRAYETVLAAQAAAIESIAPGVAAADVDATARDIFAAAGMAEAFMHSLGHGIGLEIHEGPRLSGTTDQQLAAGMIVTVEPGVYFADQFGIRVEDDVLVTDAGCEVLSRFPKGLADCRLMR